MEVSKVLMEGLGPMVVPMEVPMEEILGHSGGLEGQPQWEGALEELGAVPKKQEAPAEEEVQLAVKELMEALMEELVGQPMTELFQWES